MLDQGPDNAARHAAVHHEALRLLGVVFHWLLVPLEAGLVLWGSLLLLVAAGWAIWGGCWMLRRTMAGLKPSAAAIGKDTAH